MDEEIDKENLPECIGVIMDGNRRWAKDNNVSSFEGHKKGYEKLRNVGRWVKELGIPYAIFYCFSTENWNRKKEEVEYLMDLFRFAFSDGFESLIRNEIRIKVIGDVTRFSPDIQNLIQKAEQDTAHFKTTMVLAMSYGGREELLHAVKTISQDKTPDEIQKITEQDFAKYLYTTDIPDPDLIIRTSGEMRLSGFLPWQAVYSELFFIKTHWPAFSREEFLEIIKEYQTRQRRHGR